MQRPKPIVHQVRQRTDEWFALRLPRVTGSEAKKVLSYSVPSKKAVEQAILAHSELGTPQDWQEYVLDRSPTEYVLAAGMKLNELAERKYYREAIVAQRLTGIPSDPEPYVSYDMKWGMVNEDFAKTLYQMQNRCIVEEAGFYEHPELAAGISPDGLVTDVATGELGLLEVKCLRSANHLFKVIETQTVPDDYYDQIQMQLWVAGLDWCDFVAFDSRLPEGLKIFVKRVPFDEKYMGWILEPAIRRFLAECDAKERYFRKLIREGKTKNETGGSKDNGRKATSVVDTKNAPAV